MCSSFSDSQLPPIFVQAHCPSIHCSSSSHGGSHSSGSNRICCRKQTPVFFSHSSQSDVHGLSIKKDALLSFVRHHRSISLTFTNRWWWIPFGWDHTKSTTSTCHFVCVITFVFDRWTNFIIRHMIQPTRNGCWFGTTWSRRISSWSTNEQSFFHYPNRMRNFSDHLHRTTFHRRLLTTKINLHFVFDNLDSWPRFDVPI